MSSPSFFFSQGTEKTFPSLRSQHALRTVWLTTSSHNQPVQLISSLHLTPLPSYSPPQSAEEAAADGISHQQPDNLSLLDIWNSVGPIQARSIHPFRPCTENRLNILTSATPSSVLSVPSVFSIAVLTTVYTFPFVPADTHTI